MCLSRSSESLMLDMTSPIHKTKGSNCMTQLGPCPVLSHNIIVLKLADGMATVIQVDHINQKVEVGNI